MREVRARRRDGKTFPVELAIGKHDTHFTCILRDVTARRELERRVLEVADTRQRRIGQELHDGVGQELTGLGLMADALVQRLNRTPTAEGLLAAKVAAGIARVHQQVRAIAHGIVPVEVDPQGLRAALQDLATRTCEQAGNACTFDTSGPVELPDAETATHLFGIAREALSNALRHGGAGNIRLALRGKGDALVLTIEDHGVGLPPAGAGRRTRGLGFRMMQYRASAIGATLNIGPSDGRGTTVRCFLSMRPPQGREANHQQGRADDGWHGPGKVSHEQHDPRGGEVRQQW